MQSTSSSRDCHLIPSSTYSFERYHLSMSSSTVFIHIFVGRPLFFFSVSLSQSQFWYLLPYLFCIHDHTIKHFSALCLSSSLLFCSPALYYHLLHELPVPYRNFVGASSSQLHFFCLLVLESVNRFKFHTKM